MLARFEVLFEANLPTYTLPADVKHLYGGLGFPTPVLYSNFVSSLDGVVTLGSKPSAGSVISGKYPADRFVMGLLRACADAVVVGAGTLRATPGHLWTPAHVYPALATEFTALRSSLGRSAEPALVLLTATGELDFDHPALIRGAIVITTIAGAKKIGRRLPPACEVVAMGKGDSLDLGNAIRELRDRGLNVLLSEGGPHVMGQLLKDGLLDEAFLTISPVVAGRGDEQRLGMVEGVELLPAKGAWSRLLSARQHGEYLFLRYGFGNA
ncbi:MAG: dihydrofolate reductase family protein [Candidatus Dormibacteraeota bacterium]|nr:dihydrofolate reductase family protein [Candidatus Dormibacteraeota bacterium]